MDRNKFSILVSYISIVAAITALVLTYFVFKNEIVNFKFMLIAIFASAYAGLGSIYFLRMKERKLRQRRIFIIYSRKDAEVASGLVVKLRDAGYNPWFDQDELTPGQKIPETIIKGLTESAVALLLVSRNVDYENGFLAKELKTALSIMRSRDDSFSPVIPIRLDDSEVPSMLSDVQWLSLTNSNDFELLQRGLKRILGA